MRNGFLPLKRTASYLLFVLFVQTTFTINKTYAQSAGMLGGIFSVGDNTQVNFSQGNLQYIGSAATPYWKFADHQWEYLGSTQYGTAQNVDRDLFGFAASGYNHGGVCYQPWSTSTNNSDYFAYGAWNYNLYDQTGKADWGYNAIANGGNQENQWRTLTKDEWVYLINNRMTMSGIRYAQAVVNNVNGMILFPDNWNASVYPLNDYNNNNYESNIISFSDWTNVLEPSGAVFLPASGYRAGTSIGGETSNGDYWSSSVYSEYSAYIFIFRDGSINPQYTAGDGRYYGHAVRLVKNIPMTMGYINAVPNPYEGGSVTGHGLYNIGETCTLVATADDKYAFVNWTKNGVELSTNPELSFSVTGNAVILANFTRTDINEITIGSGTSNYSEEMPLYSEYSLVQQIYTAEEIGTDGPIDEISFYFRGNANEVTANIDVYLKHTAKTGFDYENDWETIELGDLYYSGSYTIGGSPGWKRIKLDTPFNYNGVDNLLVCIDNNSGNISAYHNWYTYQTNSYRSLTSWGWNDFDPFNPSDGSRKSYVNQIKLGFIITQETNLAATPNPINMGYRPNGAWMSPFKVNILNTGRGAVVNSVSTTNPYFQFNNIDVPFYLGYNQDFDIDLNTGTSNGEINSKLIINYGVPNQQEQFDIIATAYTPSIGDVWETASELTVFPFSASVTPAYTPLFNNYRLPPSSISDGPDAVYKLVFTEDTYLNASVSNGENGKVAIYAEGFENVGGPDLDNCYYGSMLSVHEWLTYDNGTTYTNVAHNSGTTTWGYKFSSANLAAYSGAKMKQVALYSNYYNGGITTLYIYKGGDNAPETLLATQTFNLPNDLNTYYNVTLDTPIRITGKDNIWVIFTADNNGHYPAATTDNYYDSQYNGCWWYDYNAGVWMQNKYYGNWKIKAYVTNDDDRSFVEVDKGAGNRNIITIGDNSTSNNQYLPSYSYYRYSLTQQLYTANEIGSAGNISSVAFYNAGSEKTRAYSIYMVNTSKMVFDNNYDWIPVTNEDMVFSGSVTMHENDWTTIQFDTPFEYNGYSNLALIVKDNTGYDSYGMTCRVFTPEAYNYCSLYTYGSGNIDPANPSSSGSRTRVKNQIQLNLTPIAENEIVNMTVVPGTYYIAASSTSDSWNIYINAETLPCPKKASNPTPANNATNVAPTLTQLKWDFGKRTTAYMLRFGTTTECEDTLVEWSRDLCNVYTLMGLNNNTTYYWKVVERNDGCPEGVESQTWSFTTQLNGPYLYTDKSYMYVGDTLQLSWNALADTCVHSYNIYQNDTIIDNCNTNYYYVSGLNYNPIAGYTFKVSAVYNGGESSFYNTRNVRVSGYGYVSGYVYEQDGSTPIRNANVAFNGRDEFNYTKTYTFVTDSTGYYKGDLCVGIYNGIASCTGYQSDAYPGTITVVYNNNVTDIDFIMDESYIPVGDVYAQYYPDSFDMTASSVKVIWNTIPHYYDSFESGDFSSLDWQLDQVYPWEISTNNPYDGNYCMKSSNHASNSTSTMQVTIDVPFDGRIGFFYKISSESWDDYGCFYIDNTQYDCWSGISDNWTERYYSISAGTHTFKWTYTKDYSGNNGDDCFYIDQVRVYVPEDKGEIANRSFQNYRIYRTDFYNNGPFTEDNTELIADEIVDTLYIDPTWADVETGVYKYGVSKVYEGNREIQQSDVMLFDFDDNSMQGWTNIDADGDGFSWELGSASISYINGGNLAGTGHNESQDMAVSGSYSNMYGVLYPDNYLVSPQIQLGGIISFYACAQDANYAAEHFGVAVSTTSNTDASAFIMLQEWTLSAKSVSEAVIKPAILTRGGNRSQGNWYQYTVDLSEYSGMGYVAIRHFNCNDMFLLDIDDIEIMGKVNMIQSERESPIIWSNPMDKDMYLADCVNITVSLNSGDTPEGVIVTFTNLNAGEQQTHPTDNNIILDVSGHYVWDMFRKGDYQICISKEGFETVTEQISIYEATTLSYELNEIVYCAKDLYVSRTGWAMWQDHNNSPIPELAGDGFEFKFDHEGINGITLIDGDGDDQNWMLASSYLGEDQGYNGSKDCMMSMSFDSYYWNYYYPNNYMVFPLSRFSANSTLSFYAYNPSNNGYTNNVSFGLAISYGSKTNINDYTVVENWTLNCNTSGAWQHYSVDLSDYAGKVGYLALIHHNQGNSSRNNLYIDDVRLTNNNREEQENRHFDSYQVMLTDTNAQTLYIGSTSNCFMQLPTENLIDGEIYHLKVACVYTTGTSEWIETDWVYQSCEHFEEVRDLDFEMDDESNYLSWTYPEIENNTTITNKVFACSYNTYGNNPTSWISYNINDPQTVSVLNSNIQVYGGDYCSLDGYVHATYNDNWYKIDTETGIIVDQGSLGMSFYDCAWDYSSNTMFGIYNNGLYLWDVEHNTTTYIGNMNVNMRVLACDYEGQLYGISYEYPSYFYRIDKLTGIATQIGSTGQYGYSSIQSGGFDHNTGKLYWACSEGFIAEINTETGLATIIANNTGYQSSWCIPYNGELSSPSGIQGAIIYRDDEFAQFTQGNSFTDTVAAGNHIYEVRVVYDGRDREPYWNTYFAMSCSNIVGGDSYTVNTIANPSAGGVITGAGTYINGLQCTLTATANDGYLFANWTENNEVVSNCPEYTFRVRENHNIVGNFIEYNPHWTVVDNPNYYDMSIIGILQFNGVEQSADYLEVGAFCDGKCRGSQMLSYNSQFHRSIITMNLRGCNNDKITFKVYDHLQGEEVDLVGMNELTFAMNTVIGSFTEPYAINFGIRQASVMQNGWNWYSTYIEQEGIDGLNMLETSLGTGGVMIKSQDEGFVINFHNIWTGSLSDINNEQMYMINTNSQSIASIVGNRVNATSHPITLYPGWTWINNPYETPISLEDALANFTPTNGDIIKSQQSFSTYMEGLGWFGSFYTLEPGVGLMYYSNNNTNVMLHYSDGLNRNDLEPNITTENNHWTPNVYEYPYNMTMSAVLMLDDMEISNDRYEVAAFAEGTCIGSNELMYNGGNSRHMAYLTVYGEEAIDIHFRLYDISSGLVYYSEDVLSFEINSIVGSIMDPYVIHFDSYTGINPNNLPSVNLYPNPVSKGEEFRIENIVDETEVVLIEIIDALGSVVSVETTTKQSIKIIAPNTAGIYTVKITMGNKESYCRKLVVK